MSTENDIPDLQRQIEDLKQQVADLQAALSERENKFRALTESAPVGFFLDDAQGNAIYINNKCAELVGVPPEEALDFNWAPYLHPDDRERMVTAWKNAFENSEEFHLEYRWVHGDGKVVWTLGEVSPLLDENGEALLYIGTLTDITAHKEAQIEKENLQEQLLQAQKMETVGRLAGGVAHDYNNMIGAIMANAEMAMTRVDESGQVHQYLQEILKAATRSADVTRQLLSFARKQVASPRIFDMNASVQDMIRMLERLIGEEIRLTWAPEAGPIPIKMDPSQFDQIVMNLCVNARDAIDGTGTVTIETATVTFDAAYCAEHKEALPGEFACVSISDNGRGMDNAMMENIFEPFFTTKEVEKGTGLGLASVYGTVKQNDGWIAVQSELGAGTTFRVHLPRATGPIGQARPAADPVSVHEGGSETILVVEDETTILTIIKTVLDKLGYKVLTADAPLEALRLANDYSERIDLVITDLIMPKLNGRELVGGLRSERPDIKCLYMSGYTADVIANQGLLEDDVNFIQKPFRAKELIAKIRETLNRE